ncbi:MAG: hypothetical protein U0163_20420 [Gemmatimonadaceae bacterium]
MLSGEVVLLEASLTNSALQLTLTAPGSSRAQGISGSFDGSNIVLSVPGSSLRVKYQNSGATH